MYNVLALPMIWEFSSAILSCDIVTDEPSNYLEFFFFVVVATN